MRTTRIHIDQPLSLSTDMALPSQAAEHVARVLRMNPGDEITVFNGDGYDYAATLVAVGKRDVMVHIDSREAVANESPLHLTLAQGVARGEKMDLIVQKATELGVARIVPLFTERSEVKLDPSRAEKRLLHWRAVAASACEQSGRVQVPDVAPAQPLQTWLEKLANDDTQRLALLPEGTLRARDVRFATARGLLVVGPEGGLGDRDVTALREAG